MLFGALIYRNSDLTLKYTAVVFHVEEKFRQTFFKSFLTEIRAYCKWDVLRCRPQFQLKVCNIRMYSNFTRYPVEQNNLMALILYLLKIINFCSRISLVRLTSVFRIIDQLTLWVRWPLEKEIELVTTWF